MLASSDNLIKLFKAFKENNQVEFTKIAYEVIEDEKKKNHNLLASKLYRILFDDNFNMKVMKNDIGVSNKQLPTDKETGIQLLEMRFPKIQLDDIIIAESNKERLNDIIIQFKNRELLYSYKLYPKSKILFCGPPGCGKTITAEGMANELELPLLYTRFDSIISSFLGETSSNLRKIFDFSKNGEWILFFDEFDAIGKSRGNEGEHGELKRVVNSFLQLMDNCPKETMIIAATNYETMIDKALWRRFDEIIYFDKPNVQDINNVIKLKLRNFPHDSLDINQMCNKMINYSYADVERVCMESIKYCIIHSISSITDGIFEKMVIQQNERENLVNEKSR